MKESSPSIQVNKAGLDFVIIYPPPFFIENLSSNFPPLGGLYLADALMKKGYTVAIIDDNINNIITKLSKAVGEKTIAIGISTLSGAQLKHAISIARYIREKYPKKPIIWGGAHVTALPAQTLRSDLVDYIIWGEGENSLPLLLNAIQKNLEYKDIPGIGFKKNGEITVTKNGGYTSLEGVFNLPYHLLEMDRYARKLKIGLNRCYPIFSSRGCPFKCKFCSNSSAIWPNTKMRYNTVEHIINDISILVNVYRADGITFSDENLFVNEERLISICESLIKSDFKVKYRTSARADLLYRLKDSTWKLLKEVGFVGITVGVESGSQRMLDFMGKGITIEQVYEVDKKLTKYGFFKCYNFMTCIPTETTEDVKQTLQVILNLAKNSLYCPYPLGILNKYIPLPGTELFFIAIKHGFNPPNSLEGWTGFDFDNFLERASIVRPWLDEDMLNYVNKANKLIEELNLLFAGEDADKQKINNKIKEIQDFINYN